MAPRHGTPTYLTYDRGCPMMCPMEIKTNSVLASCCEPDCRWRYRNDDDYTEVHVRAESHAKKRGHRVIVEHVDTYHVGHA